MTRLLTLLTTYVTRGTPAQPRTAAQVLALQLLVFLLYSLLYGVYALLAAGGAFIILAFWDTQKAVHIALAIGALGALLALVGALVQSLRLRRTVNASRP